MAMPRRELFAVNGFTGKVELPVLDCIANESWFSTPSALAADLDAREVRLGLMLCQGTGPGAEILVSEDGIAVHCAAIPPEVEHFGPRLAALKNLARSGGRELARADGPVDLLGYCCEEALSETRGSIILVYRMRLPAGTAPPAGFSWVAPSGLRNLPLDPASTVILAGILG